MKNHWTKQYEIASQHSHRPKSRSREQHKAGHKPRRGSRSRFSHNRKKSPTQVHQVKNESETDSDSFCIYSVSNQKKSQLEAKLKVKDTKAILVAQVDTGAGVNLLPIRCFKQLYPDAMLPNGKPDLENSTITPRPLTTLTAYGGQEISQYGTIDIGCIVGQELQTVQFYVCESDGPIILGLKDSCKMKLIDVNKEYTKVTISVINKSMSPDHPIKRKNELIEQYPEVFSGIDKLPGKVKLQLKDDAVPVVQAPRRCPIHLRNEIQSTLDEMERQEIISKVPTGQPTEWLSNLVYARKSNGKLRVCLDPRDLNANIKRTYHRAPTVEEITHKLADAHIFSKLDAKNGYWSLVLDDESSLLTTFNSPSKRYKFNRLPFGINVSQDLFQEAMDNITRDLKGVISIADDICVFGKDEREHDTNLYALLEKG